MSVCLEWNWDLDRDLGDAVGVNDPDEECDDRMDELQLEDDDMRNEGLRVVFEGNESREVSTRSAGWVAPDEKDEDTDDVEMIDELDNLVLAFASASDSFSSLASSPPLCLSPPPTTTTTPATSRRFGESVTTLNDPLRLPFSFSRDTEELRLALLNLRLAAAFALPLTEHEVELEPERPLATAAAVDDEAVV